MKEHEQFSGFATPEGTATYSKRSSLVHPGNFKSVEVDKEELPLTLSKMMLGTATGADIPLMDFFQYMNLRLGLLSGGINHIDTGHFLRNHRSEHVVGKTL